jgi:hypothetical protein
VLYQLSYAPGRAGLYPGGSGTPERMTDQPQENMDREQQERERETDVLEHEQEGKGYGEDEGEREGALPEGDAE